MTACYLFVKSAEEYLSVGQRSMILISKLKKHKTTWGRKKNHKNIVCNKKNVSSRIRLTGGNVM